MEVKRELDFYDLDSFFWSGAKDRWNDATDDQKELVWDRIQDIFMGEIPTETEINDFVWFECDDIFDMVDEDEEFESARRRNIRRVSESRRAKRFEKKLVEQKKSIDSYDFDMCLMSLANMAEDLDYITSNEPEVPRYVYKCLELAEALDKGISFILKSNNKDLSKTMKDERLRGLRPTFSLFLSNAEKVRKEIEHPEGDYWSRSYELRHFVEYLEEISSVLDSVL